jgi:hypothetical protein
MVENINVLQSELIGAGDLIYPDIHIQSAGILGCFQCNIPERKKENNR